MSTYTKTVQTAKGKKLPREGGRGLRDRNKSRDKTVRITSELYEEMMAYVRKRQYNADFHDICSEVWESFKKAHKGT